MSLKRRVTKPGASGPQAGAKPGPSKAPTRFERVIAELERAYGRQKPPPFKNALEMILWENVAYLADDERRLKAFRLLEREVGLEPAAILAAPRDTLLEIARAGIAPENSVEKLRRVARIAIEEFGGTLDAVPRLPLEKAREALKMFPGIGDPGAGKILLFTRAHASPALESNGLRVLLRLGFGRAEKSYAASYRSVLQALDGQHGRGCDGLIRAHLVLRRHGQQLCRRNAPLCDRCPVALECRYYQGGLGGAAPGG